MTSAHVHVRTAVLLEAFPVADTHILPCGVAVALTATIASLLWKEESLDTKVHKKWDFVKSVGGTDKTDNSENIQFTGPNGLKIIP